MQRRNKGMPASPGIFCLEGQWEDDLSDRATVRPTLELLERLGEIRFIHKDVATAGDLDFFLDRWSLQRYAGYAVGYFAMHGSGSLLHLTKRHSVSLHHIADQLSGKCAGRRLYFGSCSVLQATDAILDDFLRRTGADLVCGYTKEVDWIESAAFDTMLLPYLASDNQRTMLAMPHWLPVVQQLGFRIHYRDGRRR
jgi:hypothetical protein